MKETGPGFLFLCGVGRSGTTILRTSLGNHPQIYYNGFENNLVQEVAAVALRNCTMPSRKASMAVKQAQYDAAFQDLIRRVVWPDAERAGRPVHMAAINPTPMQLDYMRQLFPNSKYIGLIRNGIEVVSSRMEFESFSSNEFATHCRVWNRSADVFGWGKLNQERFRPIRHEWFYEPETLRLELQKLYAWLSIEHSPCPEENILGTLQHPTSAEFTIEGREFVESAIDRRRKYFLSKRERWKTFSDQQKALFVEQCGENMAMLGYDVPL